MAAIFEAPAQRNKSNILVSCTTFFRPTFSIHAFINNFRTLYTVDPTFEKQISKLIILNEYSEENLRNSKFYEQLILREFPKAKFVQKDALRCGQAQSLNFILDACRSFDYQLHWEEGWICRHPFLADAVHLLESSEYTQVSVTEDWIDSPLLSKPIINTVANVAYRHLQLDKRFRVNELLAQTTSDISEILAAMDSVDMNIWPMYSLRPGVNRVAFIKNLPMFNTDPRLWPVKFEYLYALAWCLTGGTKAMLAFPRCFRSDNKNSTYKI